MIRNFPLNAFFVLAAITFAGCAKQQPSGVEPQLKLQSTDNAAPAQTNPVFANQLAAGAGGPAKLRIVQMDVYQLAIPMGAISRSEEFWKHVEEQSVDVGTYDLLRKNGWRIGTAPTNDWNYFRDIIDSFPASTKRTVATSPNGAGGIMEIPMKKDVLYQNIFYFTDTNSLFGKTYERCENLLNITIQQIPRKPTEARVTVCPVVRSLRKRFEVTNNKEREIRYVYPEHLYDLNLQVDVALGQFLILAPSPEVKWKTSLGATFLVDNGAAERVEQVLLLVPHAEELQEAAPAAASK